MFERCSCESCSRNCREYYHSKTKVKLTTHKQAFFPRLYARNIKALTSNGPNGPITAQQGQWRRAEVEHVITSTNQVALLPVDCAKVIEWKICILLYIILHILLLLFQILFPKALFLDCFFIPLFGFAGFCKVSTFLLPTCREAAH